VFEPIVDVSGRSIASASLFGDVWEPLRHPFFDADPPADPRSFCVDVMFDAPAGGFPATVDLRGSLPLEVRDPTNDVRVDGLATTDDTPRVIEGLRARDPSIVATVRMEEGVLIVRLEGAADGAWLASLVDSATGTEHSSSMASSYDQVQELGFHLSDGLQGKHLVLYRRAQVNVPFQLDDVQLVKHEGS
jgi:hypothetical protein